MCRDSRHSALPWFRMSPRDIPHLVLRTVPETPRGRKKKVILKITKESHVEEGDGNPQSPDYRQQTLTPCAPSGSFRGIRRRRGGRTPCSPILLQGATSWPPTLSTLWSYIGLGVCVRSRSPVLMRVPLSLHNVSKSLIVVFPLRAM